MEDKRKNWGDVVKNQRIKENIKREKNEEWKENSMEKEKGKKIKFPFHELNP